MTPSDTTYDLPSGTPSSVVREDTIESGFIGTFQGLKYEYRSDITNRATVEQNFREKFDPGNGYTKTLDSELGHYPFVIQNFSSGISHTVSTLLKDNPDIVKSLFVVDRQTREGFNKFQEGCVEENTDTATIVRRLLSEDYADKVIVTGIQKFGLAMNGLSE